MSAPGGGTSGESDHRPPVTSVDATDPPDGIEADLPLAFPERDPAALDDTTELYLMGRHAADDGSVTVQVLGWERDGDAVNVEYSLPTGERRTDRYRWPTAGQYDESDFVALVRGLGYAPGAAEHVAGEFARARQENGRWRIVTGRRTRTSEGRDDRPKRANGDTPRDDQRLDGTRREGSDSQIARTVRRRLDGVDPMNVGMVSVVLVFLSVLLPASIAIVTGGVTAPVAALGATLFAVAIAALWLSIVVAAT